MEQVLADLGVFVVGDPEPIGSSSAQSCQPFGRRRRGAAFPHRSRAEPPGNDHPPRCLAEGKDGARNCVCILRTGSVMRGTQARQSGSMRTTACAASRPFAPRPNGTRSAAVSDDMNWRTDAASASSLSATAPEPLLTRDGAPAASVWSLDPTVRHLNHGSCGAVPREAQERQQEFRREMYSNAPGWSWGLATRIAGAREEIAAFLQVDPSSLAGVQNVSAGVSTVLRNLFPSRRSEIVVTDHAYGAVLMGAQRQANEWGGKLTIVHIPIEATAREATARVAEQISERTALVLVDQITSATARRLPVETIIQTAHDCGARVLVDGAHAPGLIPQPTASFDADYWVGDLHKWACSAPGVGVLVPSAAAANSLYPLIDSWGGCDPYPGRFDHQGTFDATSILTAGVAVRTVEDEFGWSSVRDYMKGLGDYAQAIVTRAFSEVMDEDADPHLGMPVDAMRLVRLPRGLATTADDAYELRGYLSARGFETAITSWNGVGFLRLAVHAYNTAADYEDLVARGVPLIAECARAVRRQ